MRDNATLDMREYSEEMLFWMCPATGTGFVEGGFSLATLIGANSRRRRLREASYKAELLARIYRQLHCERLSSKVNAILDRLDKAAAEATAAAGSSGDAAGDMDDDSESESGSESEDAAADENGQAGDSAKAQAQEIIDLEDSDAEEEAGDE